MRNRGAGIEQGRHAGLPLRAIAVAVAIGALAPVAIALWASTTNVYEAVTLGARSTGNWSQRVDTVVVSDRSRPEKPDQTLLSIAGTSQAAAADSQYYALVKSKRNGKLGQIGADSLVLRPDPCVVGAQTGETRLIAWVADTLVVYTRNPKKSTVTGAKLTITAERLR